MKSDTTSYRGGFSWQGSRRFLPVSALLFASLLCASGAQAAGSPQKPVESSARVMQEVTTKVYLSNRDINRITCPNGGPVKDVVYSTEKGVSVKIEGANAFVKFLVVKDGITGKEKKRSAPVEFYVICEEDDIFTIIALPRDIPARHVQLVNGKKNIQKNLSLFEGIPFERKVIMMCQKVYTDKIPDSFTIRKVHRPVRVFQDIDVVLNRVVIAEGEEIRLKEYILSLKESCKEDSLQVAEKNFLLAELAEDPVAIALESHTLQAKRPRRLFILERARK